MKCYRSVTGAILFPITVRTASVQGPVVRKPINANPGLTNNQGFNFSYINVVFHDNILWSLTLVKVKTEEQKI